MCTAMRLPSDVRPIQEQYGAVNLDVVNSETMEVRPPQKAAWRIIICDAHHVATSAFAVCAHSWRCIMDENDATSCRITLTHTQGHCGESICDNRSHRVSVLASDSAGSAESGARSQRPCRIWRQITAAVQDLASDSAGSSESGARSQRPCRIWRQIRQGRQNLAPDPEGVA